MTTTPDTAPVDDTEPDQQPHQQPDPGRWRILAVTMSVAFMALLDVSIVNIALPSMEKGLAATPSTIQWVVSGYALTFGLVLVTGGRLGDSLGRRRMMLSGISLFVASSLACGLAPTIGWLVLARLVQGAAAGLITPQNAGMIQTYFRGAERATAFGFMGTTVGVATAVGPVVGGLIIATFGADTGWRWIFLVNVPIGLALLVGVARIVPGRQEGSGRADLDVGGALLLACVVFCTIYPISTLETGVSWQLAILLGIPVFGLLWLWYERRVRALGRAPLLDVDLLRRTPGYASGMLIGCLYFTGFSGVMLTYSVYLQNGLGLETLRAALLLTPFALSSAVASQIGGRLVPRLGRGTTVLAMSVMLVGMVASAILIPMAQGTGWFYPVVVATMVVTGLGGGAVVSPNMALSLSDVPVRMAGAAGAALQTVQRMGTAVGSAAALVVYSFAADRGPGTALRAVLVVSALLVGLTLLIAVRDLRVTGTSSLEG